MTQETGKGKYQDTLMFIYDFATERAEKEGRSHRDAFKLVCELVELINANEMLERTKSALERSTGLYRKAKDLYGLMIDLMQRAKAAYAAGDLEEGDSLRQQSLVVEAQAIGRELQAAKADVDVAKVDVATEGQKCT